MGPKTRHLLCVGAVLLATGCAGAEPPFVQVTRLSDTRDTLGPYQVRVVAIDDREVASVQLYYRSEAVAGAAAVPLERSGEDTFEGEIPGFPPGTTVHYFVEAVDSDGHAAYDPPEARFGDARCIESSSPDGPPPDAGAAYCFRVLR